MLNRDISFVKYVNLDKMQQDETAKSKSPPRPSSTPQAVKVPTNRSRSYDVSPNQKQLVFSSSQTKMLKSSFIDKKSDTGILYNKKLAKKFTFGK